MDKPVVDKEWVEEQFKNFYEKYVKDNEPEECSEEDIRSIINGTYKED